MTGLNGGMPGLGISFTPFGRPQENFSGRGPKNYTRPDVSIHEDVCELLTEHPEIDASRIEVKVTEGKVILNGAVADRATKHLVEDEAARIRGVADVENNLRVEKRSFKDDLRYSADHGVTAVF